MNTQKKKLIVLLLCVGVAVFAGTNREAQVLDQLFNRGPESIAYTKQFESVAPMEQVKQLLFQLTLEMGTFRGVEGSTNPYQLLFDRGSVTTYIALDAQGAIAGLQFTEINSFQGTLTDAVQKIIDMDAETSVLIRKNGETVLKHNSDLSLAVGSSFKLGVLAALVQEIEKGNLTWSTSVPLNSAWKTLPSGILQDWPEGSQLTIETLATLMISISDNTACDALIALVGRRNVEAFLPRCIPLFTTGDLFRLKNPDNSDLLSQYRQASLMGKRVCLEELGSRQLPSPSLFSSDPIALDIEWYATVEELCDLMEKLQDLDLMTINSGVATKEHWKRVAYKGGSEPGGHQPHHIPRGCARQPLYGVSYGK